MKERRKYPRANSAIEFLFYHDKNDRRIYSIKSKNIGPGGCYLIYNKEIPAGTMLRIGLDLNNSEIGAETVKSMVLRCVKIRENIYGLGVEFKNISEKMKKAIANHVQYNQNKKPLADEADYLNNTHSWDTS